MGTEPNTSQAKAEEQRRGSIAKEKPSLSS